MNQYFNVTSIGFSHIRANRPCQDFSASYSDGKRIVITACDGHGGDIYVRSQTGSKLAATAALRAMLDVESLHFRQYTADEIAHSLKLNVLCEWNRLVNHHLRRHPLRAKELSRLSKDEAESLRQNPVRAYGSTLGCAMLLDNRLLCVNLGDGGCFLLKDGNVRPAFPEDEDEPVANVTHSLCGEDAFLHMNAEIFDARDLDGVLLCTDGVTAPYGSMENFKRALVHPVVRCLLNGKAEEVKRFIHTLGTQCGIGDDVSLSVLLKDNIKAKDYQN